MKTSPGSENPPTRGPGSPGNLVERAYRAWEQFWFLPADPTRLGLIRIGTGIIVLLTFLSYSFALEEFVGPHAWLDLATRLDEVRDTPNDLVPLAGNPPLPPPRNELERLHVRQYVEKFNEPPPPPYPQNEWEDEFCIKFRAYYGVDPRKYGMPIPRTPGEAAYVEEFARRHFQKHGFFDAPGPPYPRDAEETREIFDYLEKYGKDLHRLVSRGLPVWSLWFYVTEPTAMQILHGLVLFTALLFTVGLGTRITGALTWFFNLNYTFRTPYTLFGADTMINILLLYLMFGPAGEALSLDRRLARWWSGNKLAVVNRWRRFWRRPALTADHHEPAAQARVEYHEPAAQARVEHHEPAAQARVDHQPPQVGANVAVRLIQVHLCIVYLFAGLAKFAGPSWWSGTAVWTVMAHPELAPMHFDLYGGALHLLAGNETFFYLFLFVGTYFTMAFEVGYPFLIWTRLRRLFLAAALLLHGLIGLVMGLQTLTLIMLVMNLAFLSDAEVQWIVGLWERWAGFLRKRASRVGH